MPTDTATSPADEPRFNPMWWWVIGAFVLLIGAWTTIIVISQIHRVQEVEIETAPAAESPPNPSPEPAG